MDMGAGRGLNKTLRQTNPKHEPKFKVMKQAMVRHGTNRLSKTFPRKQKTDIKTWVKTLKTNVSIGLGKLR